MMKQQIRAPQKDGIIHTKEAIFAAFVAHNVQIVNQGNCKCATSKLTLSARYKTLSCDCLGVLLEDIDNILQSVAHYQFYFAGLSLSEQTNRFLEWMKHAELGRENNSRYKFIIPFIPEDQITNLEIDELFKNNLVCINALLVLLGKGFSFIMIFGGILIIKQHQFQDRKIIIMLVKG